MKLATWNINSIRPRLDRLLAWLERERPDVLCLQETKVEDAGFPFDAVRAAGYEVATFGQRSYNGVAILSRTPLVDVTRGMGDGEPEPERTSERWQAGQTEPARVIAATIEGLRVVCIYVPNGQDLASDKYTYKLAWFARLRAYLERTSTPASPLIVTGDINVAPEDRDVWSPAAWDGLLHCSPPERAALANVLAWGLDDLYRKHHADGGVFSWWDYRGVSFFKNQGLRIDHIFGTAAAAARCTDVTIDRAARKGEGASDHAPVIATLT